MAVKEEQETTVTWTAGDDVAYIYTAVPKHLRRLRSDKRVTEFRGGNDEWGNFLVPINIFDPLNGFRQIRKKMTPEQKTAAAKRLAEVRNKKGTTSGDTE